MKKLLLFLLFPIGLFAQSPVSDATITTNITNLSNMSSTYTNEKPKFITILNQITLSKPNILINPGYLFVGNVSGVGTGVPLSGVVSMSSSGVTTFVPTTLSGFGITDAQPLNSNLTTIAGLAATTNNLIVSVGGAWASRTPSQVKATLAIANTDVSGLGTAATQNNSFFLQTANNLSDVTASTARTNLGLGSLATTTPGTGITTALGINIGSVGAPIVNGGAAGTFASGVATNLTGTASGFTAGTVTTNANLTGPITSVGNTTSIAAQTGTGSTFVMSANPTITGTPTLTLTNGTGLPPTTGIVGWPSNSAGVLTNNGSGALIWGSAGTSYTADESTLHLTSTTFSLKSSFYNTTPTASNLAEWDANKNLFANNFIPSYNTSAAAGGSTTLTVSSPTLQYRTGTGNETITLPVTSTLTQGLSYTIDATQMTAGTLTINSSGGNIIQSMAAGSKAFITCILTSGTTAASWGPPLYFPPSPLTTVGDILVGGTVVNGLATPSALAAGTSGFNVTSNGIGVTPTYQAQTSNRVVATNTNDAATAGNIGEPIRGTAVTTYTNLTTSATYKNVASVPLTGGDWIIEATFTLFGNGATITTTADAIAVVSTTTASATGAVEGQSIYYIPQQAFALNSSAHASGKIVWHITGLTGSQTYYLNIQGTYSVGSMQYVGNITAWRPR